MRRDLFHADKPNECEACRAQRLHTEAELCEHHPAKPEAIEQGIATAAAPSIENEGE